MNPGYQFLTQYDSPNFTPASQCVATWGVSRKLYASEGAKIAIHWWGDPNTNPSLEGVISTLCNPARQASAHFVATGTGRRVACLVNTPDASWATGPANPFTFSIECDPRCRNEDYDVVAELIAELRKQYGDLPLVPHRQYMSTACPGNYDLGRLDREARNKVAGDEFGTSTNPAPAIPVDSRPEWEKNFVKYGAVKLMYAIDNITPLRGFNALADVITNYRTGQSFEILGDTVVGGNKYYMTKWSIEHGKWNGFDAYELTDKDPGTVPPPVVNPDPTVPSTTPPATSYDTSQDARISALEALVGKIAAFLESVFNKIFNK